MRSPATQLAGRPRSRPRGSRGRGALHALLCAGALAAGGHAVAQAAPPPETLFPMLEQALAELPKAEFDFGAALAAIPDQSVEAIFAWVRDETGYVPYRGALKGARGTLMDRAGNSLDRALLLERLLEEAGHHAIVARATLSGAELDAALAALRPAPPLAAPAQDDAALAERAEAELNIDPELLAARLAQSRQEAARLALSLERATARQAAAIAELIAASAAGREARDGVEADAATTAARLLADHWWVQVERNGAWVDLDPTLREAAVGQPLTPAAVRFDLPEVRFLAAIDGACRDLSCGDRLHRVRIAVIIETWDGADLHLEELMSTELLAADGPGQSVAFTALPTDWPEGLDLFGVTAPLDALREQLLRTDEWQPTLFHAGTSIGTTRISASGKLNGAPAAGGAAGNAGMLGGGVGGMFGGFGGGTAGASGEEAGAFTALWLEYTVHTPGLGESRHLREVFDLIGPAARRAGPTEVILTDADRLRRAVALGGETAIVVAGSGLTPRALHAAAAVRLLGNQAAWSELYYQGATLDPSVIGQRLDDTADLYAPLELLQLERAGRLQGPQAGAFVAAFHRRFEPDLSVSSAFDLVAGAVTALPRAGSTPVSAAGPAGSTGTSGGSAFDTRLAQGVLDTVLESELAARFAGAPGVATEAGRTVAEAFAADLAAGRPWQLVSSSGELADLFANVAPGLPADLHARIAADLEAGRLALVPTDAASAIGWWSLDPASGALLGMGDRGWGQAMAEYSEITNIALQLRTVVNQYASMSRCLGLALTGPLRGLTSADADHELQECVFTTICSGVNTALSNIPQVSGWTEVLTMAAIDALWGGVPELGADYGGLCGSLWKKIKG